MSEIKTKNKEIITAHIKRAFWYRLKAETRESQEIYNAEVKIAIGNLDDALEILNDHEPLQNKYLGHDTDDVANMMTNALMENWALLKVNIEEVKTDFESLLKETSA